MRIRIFEICKLRVEDLKKALENEKMFVRGKGGRNRTGRMGTAKQWKLVKWLYAEAKLVNKKNGDFVISRSVKYGTMEKKSRSKIG